MQTPHGNRPRVLLVAPNALLERGLAELAEIADVRTIELTTEALEDVLREVRPHVVIADLGALSASRMATTIASSTAGAEAELVLVPQGGHSDAERRLAGRLGAAYDLTLGQIFDVVCASSERGTGAENPYAPPAWGTPTGRDPERRNS